MKKIYSGNFTALSNDIINNKNASLKAKGLFLVMWSKPDSWVFSINGLKTIVKENESAISSGIKELEKLGYLKRKYFYNEKGHKKAVYFLIENPSKENPTLENPSKENPSKENPSKENQSNNKRNNKIIKEINNNRNNNVVVDSTKPTQKQIELAKAKGIDYSNSSKIELAQLIETAIKNETAYNEPNYEIADISDDNIISSEELEELLNE